MKRAAFRRPAYLFRSSLLMVVVPVAAVSYVIEFATAFVGLFAVLAVLIDGDAQIVFGLVNISLTSILSPRGQGRTNQADDCQQGYTKNSDSTSHLAFSF
jgi:hypothetical protein